MCGIFAVLYETGVGRSLALEGLEGDIGRLIRYDPGAETPGKALRHMKAVRRQCYRWVRPEGFLTLAGDPSAQGCIQGLVERLEAWLKGLEHYLEARPGLSQEEREHLNRLLVGGRDTIWQLGEDVLGNLPRIQALVPEAEASETGAFRHAWALNLILNSIDRLEVRGRDSAGVAVYTRFPTRSDLEKFLDVKDRRTELMRRAESPAFTHLSAVQPPNGPEVLLFAFKIADEVGEMGQNVRFLRDSMAKDQLFQEALAYPGVEIQAMGHTRWASNGIISLPNTHPVDSTVLEGHQIVARSQGSIVAALNGDIDNFQELYRKYVNGGQTVDPGITTDAKIIPVVVEEHLKRSGGLEEAFAAAFDEFEGSMAICLMAADRPGEFICAQKGSGQGLFMGFAGETVAVASEMYGLVELTPEYVKAEGEREEGARLVGETFLVRTPPRGGVRNLPGGTPVDASRIFEAEITTRDINRGSYPRFLLKEIFESRHSVNKTIRGKVAVEDGGRDAHILLSKEMIPASLVDGLKSGRIRRIIPMGQGTAAVAAQGIAYLLESNLKGTAVEVTPMKATELSGHHLAGDMSDCLVVAVSQSGTTTDTNRTVDLVRERGAFVIGIVNRRNSDLVYKSNAVLYTSDGRDIEMSVASTKAFYAQNVAGEILALALAEALGLLDTGERVRKVESLLALPAAMEGVLALSSRIEEIAARTALKRRYWAVVGTGASKIAADEIRIKLSELCYKAIAVDHLEDKKHIDLSSEPMIIVCASGLPPATVNDVVKEVAIFKAHRSLPIVIADEDEHRFDPYAAHLIPVPRYEGDLGYLLPTMVGHLYGYHAAKSFDRQADLMRKLRLGLVKEMETGNDELTGTELWKMLGRSQEITSNALELQHTMESGRLNSGLEVGTATRLSSLLDFLLGRIPLDAFMHRFRKPGTVWNLLATLVEQLSTAVNELCRPIDAIKHQAKTVTVGISRQAEQPLQGPLWSLIKELRLDPGRVAASHGNTLSSLEPIIEAVSGATLYKVEGLTPIGKPLYTSTIRVERKLGCAGEIPSRCEAPRRLSGTKWGVVADSKIFLGRGQNDKRRILILPVIGQRDVGYLLLYHIEFMRNGPRDKRMAALKSLQDRYKQILICFTEATGRDWDQALIDRLDNDQLFLDDPREVGAFLKNSSP